MQTQEIEITIDKDGRVSLRVIGVKGESCVELTKKLERVLGNEIENREMTPEAYECVEEQTQLHQRIQ